MIKLDIYDFCQNCTEFEPQVAHRPSELNSNFGIFRFGGDTIIECKRRRNCEAVHEYLKKEKKNNAEN